MDAPVILIRGTPVHIANETLVEYEVQDRVAIVRLNRPEKLNAFTRPMLTEIRAAVERAESDEQIGGLIVTGTGRGFCAGFDTGALQQAAAQGGTEARDRSVDPEELPALFSFLLRVPKPVIAAVNGVSAGGGFVLAMMCDLRFAADSARFTTSFSRRGLIAEHGTSWLLPRMIGPGRALDLLWSARQVDAQEAYRLGLVDRVFPGDRLVDEARTYLADLSANVSPRSIAVMKAQVYRHLSEALGPAIRESHGLMEASLGQPDAMEGVVSFLERRSPHFPPWKGGRL
jgi:enoyl-CoA hydratase/carnithine racemase